MIKQQIQADATQALKQGDKTTAEVLRMIVAVINSKEKEKRYALTKESPAIKEEDLIVSSQLTDEETMATLSSEIKKRRDAIVLYQKGNRPELAKKEEQEIVMLQKYLPEQLSQDELKKLVQESIATVGAKEIKDMGRIMADLLPKVKGKAENSQISKIVKELL